MRVKDISAEKSMAFCTVLAVRPASTRLSILLLAIGTVLLLSMEWLLFPLTVDDAYISFRYSDNLAQGHGLVWNVGDDPVEGYTNFLWVLLGTAVLKLGLPLPISMKLLSVTLSVLSLFLIYRTTQLLSSQAAHPAVPALLFASMPSFALWAIAGLETGLFVFLLIASIHSHLSEEEAAADNRGFWSVLILTLLALTRPEGMVVFGTLVLLRLLLWIRQRAPRKRVATYVVWVFVFASLYLAYFVWRWSYFGHPFPNTAYVKASSGLSEIGGHIGVYLMPYGLRIFPFILLALYGLGRSNVVKRGDLYVGAVLIGILLPNLVSSDWMPGHRLALPMTLLVLLLAREPLDLILRGTMQGPKRHRLIHASLLLSLVLYAAAPLLYTANLYHRVMSTQMDMSIYRWAREMQTIVDGQYVKVGQWLAKNAPPDATVVAANVGAIGYLSDLKTIDMIGLTDEYIARHGWTVDYLLQQEPEFIVLESDTRDSFGGLYGTSGELFAADPIFRSEYQLLFVLDNGRTGELALFVHYLPHATWLFARKDLNLARNAPSVE